MGKEYLLTPPGKVLWNWIDRPDTKFDRRGWYSISVGYNYNEDKAGQAFAKAIETRYKLHCPNGDRFPWRVNEDDSTISFKFSSRYAPVVCDRNNANIPLPANIGKGSIVRVKFYPSAYDKGLNLYLVAVQVIDLVVNTYSSKRRQRQEFDSEYADAETGFSDDEAYDASGSDSATDEDTNQASGEDEETTLPF